MCEKGVVMDLVHPRTGKSALETVLTDLEFTYRQFGVNGNVLVPLPGERTSTSPDPAVRATGLRRLDLLIRNAAALGTNMVTLCTGTRDARIGLGLIGLQASADVVSHVDVGDVDGNDGEGRL